MVYLERLAKHLRGKIADRIELLSDHSELVIDRSPDDSWVYYFADKKKKTIFWVDNISLSTVLASCTRFVSSDSHLGRDYFALIVLLADYERSRP